MRILHLAGSRRRRMLMFDVHGGGPAAGHVLQAASWIGCADAAAGTLIRVIGTHQEAQ